MAAAVWSEVWEEAAAISGAAALLLARVRGPSVAAYRCMRAISSPNGSVVAARQLSRHCWVEEDLVALPPRAGAARAMRGNRRRRARVSHVCSRSRACSRQVSDWAHVEEAAMGTLRSVKIRVSSRCTRSMPAGRGPASGEHACAGGGGRVAQGQYRQYRRGAAWCRALRPFRRFFPPGQAHTEPQGVEPGVRQGQYGR